MFGTEISRPSALLAAAPIGSKIGGAFWASSTASSQTLATRRLGDEIVDRLDLLRGLTFGQNVHGPSSATPPMSLKLAGPAKRCRPAVRDDADFTTVSFCMHLCWRKRYFVVSAGTRRGDLLWPSGGIESPCVVACDTLLFLVN